MVPASDWSGTASLHSVPPLLSLSPVILDAISDGTFCVLADSIEPLGSAEEIHGHFLCKLNQELSVN